MAKSYINANFLEHKNVSFIRSVYASPAALAIIPMQDILGIDGRMYECSLDCRRKLDVENEKARK